MCRPKPTKSTRRSIPRHRPDVKNNGSDHLERKPGRSVIFPRNGCGVKPVKPIFSTIFGRRRGFGLDDYACRASEGDAPLMVGPCSRSEVGTEGLGSWKFWDQAVESNCSHRCCGHLEISCRCSSTAKDEANLRLVGAVR